MRENGSADFGQGPWQIRSVNNLMQQKGNFPLARFGYEFVLEDRVVGAVEVQGNGRLWMQPDLSAARQDELSALTAALLYYGSLLELQEA